MRARWRLNRREEENGKAPVYGRLGGIRGEYRWNNAEDHRACVDTGVSTHVSFDFRFNKRSLLRPYIESSQVNFTLVYVSRRDIYPRNLCASLCVYTFGAAFTGIRSVIDKVYILGWVQIEILFGIPSVDSSALVLVRRHFGGNDEPIENRKGQWRLCVTV